MNDTRQITIEEIRRRLRDHNLSAVAKATGLSNDTLYRLMNGVTTPSPATVVVISLYLKGATDGET
jgi:DNA-binding phage protein